MTKIAFDHIFHNFLGGLFTIQPFLAKDLRIPQRLSQYVELKSLLVHKPGKYRP